MPNPCDWRMDFPRWGKSFWSEIYTQSSAHIFSLSLFFQLAEIHPSHLEGLEQRRGVRSWEKNKTKKKVKRALQFLWLYDVWVMVAWAFGVHYPLSSMAVAQCPEIHCTTPQKTMNLHALKFPDCCTQSISCELSHGGFAMGVFAFSFYFVNVFDPEFYIYIYIRLYINS